jgi:hypothetical protein
MDFLRAYRVVFEANLLPNLIKQLGLVIYTVFLSKDVAFPAANFRLDKDLIVTGDLRHEVKFFISAVKVCLLFIGGGEHERLCDKYIGTS